MREQVERLESHTDLLADPLRANVRVVHLDPLQKDVTRVWLDEEVDATEQRALARTTRAHDDEDFSLFHLHVDSSYDLEVSERLVNLTHFDHRPLSVNLSCAASIPCTRNA